MSTPRSTFTALIEPSAENFAAVCAALTDEERAPIWNMLLRVHGKKIVMMAVGGQLKKDEEKWKEATVAMIAASVPEEQKKADSESALLSPPKPATKPLALPKKEWVDKAAAPAEHTVAVASKPKRQVAAVGPTTFSKTFAESLGIVCADRSPPNKCTCIHFAMGLVGGKLIKQSNCLNGKCTFLHQLSAAGKLIMQCCGYAYVDGVKYKVWYLEKIFNKYVGCPTNEIDRDSDYIPHYIEIPRDAEFDDNVDEL